MRAKAIAVFLTVVVSLIGVSLFQVDRALFSDQVAGGEAAARSQMAALIPAFHSEFKSMGEHFKFAGPLALVRPVDFGDNISNRLEMVARLQPEGGSWEVSEKVFHEKTAVKSWAENYTRIALKAVTPRDLPLGGTSLSALLDPQRRPFFLWIMRDESNNWWAAITKSDVFQAVIDRQRGQSSSIFLVNKQGQALGHTTAEYVGTILKDNPVVRDLTTSGKRSGNGIFTDAEGQEIQGFYEIIPGTNVNVVLTRPMSNLNSGRSSMRWQLIFLGGGLALLGLAALLVFVKDPPRRLDTSSVPMYAAGGGVSVPQNSPAQTPAGGPSFDQKAELVRERSKAYTTVASALAREMQGPLTRILSQAQILKAKNQNDPEINRIEELAREGRGVISKLLSFSGEEDFKTESTSLTEVLNRTLSVFESRFQQKGIKVDKNLKRMPEVQAHPLALMKVFEAVLNNAIEAMERMPAKHLQVDLVEEGEFAVIRFKDSGEGISPDKVGMVFDPFFTTKSPSVHSGLGLATVFGLVREFGGDLKFESQPGKGSTLQIRFPIGVKMAAADMAAKSVVRPQNQALASVDAAMELDQKSPSAPAGFEAPKAPAAAPKPTPRPMAPPTNPVTAQPAGASVADMKPAAKPRPAAPVSTPKPAAPQPAAPKTGAPKKGPMIVEETSEFDLELSGELAPEKDSFIQDKAIEQTLDMIDNVEMPNKKPVGHPRIDPPPPRSPEMTAGGKLDRPAFAPKKAPPKATGMEVQIRRPGERK